MTALEEVNQLWSRLTRADKAQLLQWAARDVGEFPGIESTPGVCGGDPCIVRTRIPVWVLAQARDMGVTDADLLADYPTLRADDLVNAWAYARANREQIDRQIQENEAA